MSNFCIIFYIAFTRHTYKGGGAYDVDPNGVAKAALFLCTRKGGYIMDNNDYRRYIVYFINHIHDNEVMRKIYEIVQKFYCNK